jgi:hypothetical protein
MLDKEVSVQEDPMGTLVFVCPTTGLEVVAGLEMDQATFAALSTVLPDIR